MAFSFCVSVNESLLQYQTSNELKLLVGLMWAAERVHGRHHDQ